MMHGIDADEIVANLLLFCLLERAPRYSLVAQSLRCYVLDFTGQLQRDQMSHFTFGLSQFDSFLDQFHRLFITLTARSLPLASHSHIVSQ